MKPARLLRCVLVVAAAAALLPARAGIESVTPLTARPERFGRVDFLVMLTAAWTDPHRSADVRLDAELVAPSGRVVAVPGFFDSGRSGQPSRWFVRFAPEEAGTYRGRVVLTEAAGRRESEPFAFEVAPSARRGFLRPGDAWTFRFANGEPFRGIGQNLCWEARNNDDSRFFKTLHEHPRFNYEYLVGTLARHGGNFTRVWMCPWNLPLEWQTVSDTDRYTDDPGHFNASAIRRLDALFDLLEQCEVYVMLTLESHVALLGSGWERNSYHRRNGGPVGRPAEFFTDPAARARFKDRLRYLVARWGWSSRLGAWEFFNEVDNAMHGGPEPIPDAAVAAWHDEMSRYLKAIDPYGHLVTTSVSHRDVAGLDRLPALDFNQRHIYRRTAAIPAVLRDHVRRAGRPYVIGEFGYEWDWSKDFNLFAAEMDRDFKHGLWYGLFSPTPILPMSWWWEFFDERGLPRHFARVRRIHDRMLAAGGGRFAEAPGAWHAPGGTALAVRCGATVFVLLVNETGAAVTGTLDLPGASATTAEVYDPDADAWAPPGAAAGPLTLPPGGVRIVIAGA